MQGDALLAHLKCHKYGFCAFSTRKINVVGFASALALHARATRRYSRSELGSAGVAHKRPSRRSKSEPPRFPKENLTKERSSFYRARKTQVSRMCTAPRREHDYSQKSWYYPFPAVLFSYLLCCSLRFSPLASSLFSSLILAPKMEPKSSENPVDQRRASGPWNLPDFVEFSCRRTLKNCGFPIGKPHFSENLRFLFEPIRTSI